MHSRQFEVIASPLSPARISNTRMILRRQSYASLPPRASPFASGSPVKRNEPCLDTPSLLLRAPWRGESPSRCAACFASPDATLICHGDFHAHRCDMNSKGVVLVLFIPPSLLFFFVLSLELHVAQRPQAA